MEARLTEQRLVGLEGRAAAGAPDLRGGEAM
jgi:hypothetical protein